LSKRADDDDEALKYEWKLKFFLSLAVKNILKTYQNIHLTQYVTAFYCHTPDFYVWGVKVLKSNKKYKEL
jgi:hypothetical protein